MNKQISGTSLIEVLVSLIIFSGVILGMLATFSQSLRITREGIEELELLNQNIQLQERQHLYREIDA